MLKRFVKFFRPKTKAPAQPELPQWWLDMAGAMEYSVPMPETYEAQAQLMTKVSYLYTAVTLTAQAAASQDFDIYNGGKEVENHELEKLLKSPNPNQTGFEFLRDTFIYRLLNGGAYWWINYVNSKPIELWLIPPGNIEPKPDENLGIREYWYYPGDGSYVVLPPEQIIWFRGFHPSNQFASLSPLVPLRLSLSTDIETQKYLNRVYGANSGRLPGIIAFKSPVGDNDWRQIKNDIKNASESRNYMMLRGVGDGVTWLQAAASVKEMETLQGREMTKQDIYEAIAPGLYQMTSVNATEANAKVGKSAFAEFTLFPMLTATSQKINKDLSPALGENITIEFDDPRQVDQALKQIEMTVYAAYHTLDEVREKFGSDPIGDERGALLPSQITPPSAPQPEQPAQPAEAQPVAPPDMTPADTLPSTKHGDHNQQSHAGGGTVRQESPGGRALGGVTTIGMNEGQYRGGQFLPTTELQKWDRAEQRVNADYMSKKQSVSPKYGGWETPPTPTSVPVHTQLSGVAQYDKISDTYDISTVSEQTIAYRGGDKYRQHLRSAAESYNSGQRWREMNEDELSYRQQRIEKIAGINKKSENEYNDGMGAITDELKRWKRYEANQESKAAKKPFDVTAIPAPLAMQVKAGLQAGLGVDVVFADAAKSLPVVMLALAINRE